MSGIYCQVEPKARYEGSGHRVRHRRIGILHGKDLPGLKLLLSLSKAYTHIIENTGNWCFVCCSDYVLKWRSLFHLFIFQVEVLGVDLSSNMLAIANEHKAKMEPEVQERVTFKKLDATSASFLAENFDVMYSRDAIMHIADKTGLYSKVFVSFPLWVWYFIDLRTFSPGLGTLEKLKIYQKLQWNQVF